MIKACWSPERLCWSVLLAPKLSCSKDPKRSTMIKEHFHAQKPNPTSLAHSFPQYDASAQSNTASLKKITDMLLLFPRSLLLVNALHSLRLLVLTPFFFLCWFWKSVVFSGIRANIHPLLKHFFYARNYNLPKISMSWLCFTIDVLHSPHIF